MKSDSSRRKLVNLDAFCWFQLRHIGNLWPYSKAEIGIARQEGAEGC